MPSKQNTILAQMVPFFFVSNAAAARLSTMQCKHEVYCWNVISQIVQR